MQNPVKHLITLTVDYDSYILVMAENSWTITFTHREIVKNIL